MWPFTQSAVTAPVVSADAPARPTDPVEESRLAMLAAKRELDAIGDEMLAFKGRYHVVADRFGRLLRVEVVGIGGRAEVEKQWRALLRRRDRITEVWYSALHSWSDAKQQAAKESAA